MYIDQTIIGHPTKRQLFEFAESLVDRHVPVSALMATHVSNCPLCAGEVKKIRASFELAALARVPAPSSELTQHIIMRARAEQQTALASETRQRPLVPRVLQMAASLIATLALAYFSFGAVIRDAATNDTFSAATTLADHEESFHYNTIEKETATVQALSTAVSLQHNRHSSPRDLEHRRFLDTLDDDMSAARAALERNPGCQRANEVMFTSVKRQLQGLRSLYLDHKL